MSRRVYVGLRYEVYARLRDQGRFGESFSDLISRIIDAANKGMVFHREEDSPNE